MKKSVSIMIAVIAFLGVLDAASPQAGTADKLASGTYIVYARSPQVWRFTVDPKTMANATVVGHFAVTAGTPPNLDVFVYGEEAFTKWRSEDAAVQAAAPKPLFSSGRKTEGDVNVKITEPGIYYLVFSNLFQYEGTKTLNTDIKLQYDKK